jgi:hypothetical protein
MAGEHVCPAGMKNMSVHQFYYSERKNFAELECLLEG